VTERLTRAQQRERTRQRLLDAAEEVFADRGIKGVSLDEVAATAGLTKGAVYSNFDSKDHLLAELIRRRATAADPAVDLAGLLASSGVSAADRFQAVGEAYAAAMRQPDGRRFLLFFVELWLYGMRHPEAGQLLNRTLSELRHTWAGEPDRAGPVADLPTGQLATLYLAVELGIGMQHLIDPEAVPAKLYARALRAVFGDDLRFPAREATEGMDT
jgi:AcrR family transcriptional regulator